MGAATHLMIILMMTMMMWCCLPRQTLLIKTTGGRAWYYDAVVQDRWRRRARVMAVAIMIEKLIITGVTLEREVIATTLSLLSLKA